MRRLTGEGSPKPTWHIALGLAGSGLGHEAGDSLGVVPRNDPAMVEAILAELPFGAGDEVPLPDGGRAPLREALSRSYDLRTVNWVLLQKWQAHSGSAELRRLVEAGDRAAGEEFGCGRELIDLFVGHPAEFASAVDFVSLLKKLNPRLYSIASSALAHPGEAHLTVAVVRYEVHGRARAGVCSTYLAERCTGERPGVFVHVNKVFRLPADGAVPIIMVGAGTGIAPFRAFLEERGESGARGRNWLVFGNPYRATDFLYQDEIGRWSESGLLTRLDTAFSRDQPHKIYVQHRMLEAGAELWAWLQEGAVFYVCGDADGMAKDVDAALHEIARVHGGLDAEAAAGWVAALRAGKRYLRDVY